MASRLKVQGLGFGVEGFLAQGFRQGFRDSGSTTSRFVKPASSHATCSGRRCCKFQL